ncbi:MULTISPECIES: hypothetical protein [unclassified Streptomyces]|uniref:hypothetical protein n=1 Tax=unclassified Streptomyces TaxID=2593676 RepID=UPI003D726A00
MTDPHQRTARTGADLRLLRAAVFAAVCVVLAGAGHSLASCAALPLWTLGTGFLAVFAVVAPLAGRARSLPGIVVPLALGQTLLHVLFGLGQQTASATVTAVPGPSSDASLVAQAARLLCGTPASALDPAQAERILVDARVYDSLRGGDAVAHSGDLIAGGCSHLVPSLPMVLGHVLAAVATGWLLRRGDLAVLRLLDLSAQDVAEVALVRSLRGALALVRLLLAGPASAPVTGPGPTALFAPPHRPALGDLQHTVIRRGPPAARVVLAA